MSEIRTSTKQVLIKICGNIEHIETEMAAKEENSTYVLKIIFILEHLKNNFEINN